MTKWMFEPGHTAATFRAMHMMVTWVTGAFKDIHGSMEFDWDSCLETISRARSTRRSCGRASPLETSI